MTTLTEDCHALRGGLEKARVANQTRQEISAIQERMREWEQRIDARRTLIDKMRIVDPTIREQPGWVEASEAVKALANEARGRLKAGGDVHTLSTDHLWARLSNASDTANDIARSALRTAWKQYIDSLGRVETLATLENRILKTPTNEQLLAKYKVAYATYQAAIRPDLPTGENSRRVLFESVEALRQIYSQMDTSAPDAVRRFLKAVETDGAALDLVTPEVTAWLIENDDPNRFIVKAKAALTWR